MKALAAVIVVAAIALVWYLRRPSETTAARPRTSSAPIDTPAMPKPPQHATRITPEERQRIQERIINKQNPHTHANGGNPFYAAPARPTLPEPTLDPDGDLEGFKTSIRDAMHEVIPMIADCYDKAGSAVPAELTVRAHLKLTGDPDIGTLVDAPSATDDHEAPLPAAFDDCLRSTLQTIELPPLTEGNEVSVTYPFVFRRE